MQRRRNKEEIVIGVNAFRRRGTDSEILTIDPQVEQNKSRDFKLRKRRNAKKVETAMKAIEETVIQGKNIMDPLLEALESYATLGEISDLFERNLANIARLQSYERSVASSARIEIHFLSENGASCRQWIKFPSRSNQAKYWGWLVNPDAEKV